MVVVVVVVVVAVVLVVVVEVVALVGFATTAPSEVHAEATRATANREREKRPIEAKMVLPLVFVDATYPARPSSMKTSMRPLPLTSTSPLGEMTKSPSRRRAVAGVNWISPAIPWDSMRLAVLTVSPHRS